MYVSDVTQGEWVLIEAYFQPTDRRGAVSKHAKRDIVNAVFYVNKTGCQWRLLPKDFPPWKTVYDHWRNWNRRGVWEQVLDALNGLHRKKTAGGLPRATALSIRKASRWPTPAKAGATTATRRRKAASGIS
jgi:transposase